jgi:preprotein translocase subunit SecY
MLQALANIFKIPDLRKKVVFSLAIVSIYRLGSHIPTPGINGTALAQFFDSIAKAQGGALFGIMSMFTGGAIERLTIFALGIMPAISASIIMQLLTVVIPALEKLAKEGGAAGMRQINQYSRYLTVVLGIIQSLFIALWVQNPMHFQGLKIVPDPGVPFLILTVITLTSGTAFIMYLGEQITERGIGNGMSLLITASIISRIPRAMFELFVSASPTTSADLRIRPLTLLFMAFMMVTVVVAVILITQGQLKIPVQYAKRIVGRKVYGGQSTYIPLRVNHAGVIPIIFAQSIILFPATLAGFIPNSFLQRIATSLSRGQLLYTSLYAFFIIFFAYFYTAITLNPVDLAENMKKYGGFVPGIRPGKPTAEFFDYVMTRITLPGAIFLAIIAVLPDMIGGWLHIPYLVASFFGGTGLLIIVGVMLDTMRQLESQLLMRHYEGFMKKGHLKGRR